ncbi:MAG: Rieske (2Fe-2S) protein [Calditrichia bacterium]
MTENKQPNSRRKFLFLAGIFIAFVIAIGTFFRGLILYLFPRRDKKSFHKYLVSRKDEIPIGEAKEITLGRTPAYVVHLEDGYRVFSGVCTHLGCIVRWEQEKGWFFCPCHKGYFSKNGEVISGPPPRPLNEYPVVMENNLVFIQLEDKTRGPWV